MFRRTHFAHPNRTFLSIALLIAATVGLGGCGGGLDGTYTPQGESIASALIESLTFKSGGKIEIKAMGQTKEGTYEIEDDRVKITISGETNIFTISGDCIDGGGMLGKFCKT